jgi:hypothetical protein
LVSHPIERTERRLQVAVVRLVFRLQLHVVVGLVQKSDQPIYLVSGLFAEPAYRSEDIGRLCVGRDVQPVQAGSG